MLLEKLLPAPLSDDKILQLFGAAPGKWLSGQIETIPPNCCILTNLLTLLAIIE